MNELPERTTSTIIQPSKLVWRLCLTLLAVVGVLSVLHGCSSVSNSNAPLVGSSQERKLQARLDGYRRSYRIYVPGSYDPSSSWPVVIAVHGAFSSPQYHEQRTGFSRVAEQEGFIVLYPRGIGLFGWLQHWNAGHCCGKALGENIDDVGFIFAALDDADSFLNIDRQRVYVTGFSNGAMLSHRIGAQRTAVVAAIAPVAGSMGGSEYPGGPPWQIPDSSRPLPVMLVHGTADDRVPYAGGPRPDRPDSQQYRSVQDAVNYWTKHNGCASHAAVETLHSGLVTRELWDNCNANTAVELWSLNNWKHTWPGPHDPTNAEEIDLDGFDTALAIWRFFDEYRAPAPARAASR